MWAHDNLYSGLIKLIKIWQPSSTDEFCIPCKER